MMNTYYLYKKTHKQTGLQYLGYTKRDPFKYTGSGHYWLRHLNKHGYDVDTEILCESTSMDEIKDKGWYYSNLWDVVNNNAWANLKPETGTGGDMGPVGRDKVSKKMKGRIKSDAWKENHSKIMTGKKHSELSKLNHSAAMSGANNGMYGRTHTAKTKELLSKIPKTYLKGKTYEEIYGPEKAAELKKLRSEHFKKIAQKRKHEHTL